MGENRLDLIFGFFDELGVDTGFRLVFQADGAVDIDIGYSPNFKNSDMGLANTIALAQ
jgi:hypothetical protein